MNEQSPSPHKTKWSRQTKLNFYIGGSLLVGAVVGFFIPFSAGNGPTALFVGLLCLAVIVGVAATIHYTNLLDELARHTHEVAYYWGSVITISICFVPVTALVGFPDFQLPSLENLLGTKTHAFAAGMGVAMVILLASYFAIWAQMWLKRK
ncbi:hypothetical protein [Aquidulcibacter sp.]|uniref:hypothetical protein n=1 Tax=Aquidulcibacter sp. TaxID=2052990 RepID=UPI0025C11F7A|nr:hypothetical protein [Aquidulcibacter sp.]MCA3692423.1 hypothetical protein [Aquidulcibacter sp.]